jgi:hypothetical protein
MQQKGTFSVKYWYTCLLQNFTTMKKILSLLVLTILTTALVSAQKSFLVSDQDVSRKEIKTIDGSSIKIKRLSKPGSPVNGDINLEKRDKEGNLIWSKYYGGKGYEYVGSFTRTADQGYLIIGTTSSYGKGNNDVYLIKTDSDGNQLWSKTYGGFFNEYGRYIKELSNGNIVVKGQQQLCEGENVGSNCVEKEWVFEVNQKGDLVGKS